MLRTTVEPTAPTSNQVAITLLLFSIALAWAILSALGEPEVHYARTIRLIWTSLLFATAALALYGWAADRQPLGNYWRLTWTGALALYLIHFSYGLLIIHEGSVISVFTHQGAIIAGANFLLTAIWSFDVLMAWRPSLADRSHQRLVAHIVVLLGFLISTLVFGSATAKWLGIFMISVLLAVGLARRLDMRW